MPKSSIPNLPFYSPPGLDVGSLLSGYCLGAIHQALFSENKVAVERTIEDVSAIWDSYVKVMKEDDGFTDEQMAGNRNQNGRHYRRGGMSHGVGNL